MKKVMGSMSKSPRGAYSRGYDNGYAKGLAEGIAKAKAEAPAVTPTMFFDNNSDHGDVHSSLADLANSSPEFTLIEVAGMGLCDLKWIIRTGVVFHVFNSREAATARLSELGSVVDKWVADTHDMQEKGML